MLNCHPDTGEADRLSMYDPGPTHLVGTQGGGRARPQVSWPWHTIQHHLRVLNRADAAWIGSIQGLLAFAGDDLSSDRIWVRYRGPLVIHAGKGFDGSDEDLDYCKKRSSRPLPDEYERGFLIGVVGVIDCVKQHRSRWFIGDYGFMLARPRAFLKPVPFKGRLGLFDVGLSEEVFLSAKLTS